MKNNQSKQTITKKQSKLSKAEIKSLMAEERDFLKSLAQFIVQEVLEAEPTEER